MFLSFSPRNRQTAEAQYDLENAYYFRTGHSAPVHRSWDSSISGSDRLLEISSCLSSVENYKKKKKTRFPSYTDLRYNSGIGTWPASQCDPVKIPLGQGHSNNDCPTGRGRAGTSEGTCRTVVIFVEKIPRDNHYAHRFYCNIITHDGLNRNYIYNQTGYYYLLSSRKKKITLSTRTRNLTTSMVCIITLSTLVT